MSTLPSNYDFEVPKTIWRLRTQGAKRVALQFPEGLLLFSLALADIIQEFVPGIVSVTVLGDVAYGACCVDDQGALACAAADALVHYGHSCLVPVQRSAIPTIYVFVHIGCDVDHLISTVELNFYKDEEDEEEEKGDLKAAEEEVEAKKKKKDKRRQRKPIAIAGTVQFAPAVAAASAALALNGFRPSPIVPQSRPLSPGEVLGCTAPRLQQAEEEEEGEGEKREGENGAAAAAASSSSSPPVAALVFVADGRFHMEALMIANPLVPAFRYDPYSRALTRERFDHAGMRRARKAAIAAAAEEPSWGIVLGTLGRQGSREVLSRLVAAARSRGKRVSVVLVSELTPAKLAALTRGGGGGGGRRGRRGEEEGGVGGGGGDKSGENDENAESGEGSGESFSSFSPPRAWAQVACPRLSIDWGEGFGGLPVLTPYEALVSLGVEKGWWVEGKGKKKTKEKEEEGGNVSSSCCGGKRGCGGGGGGGGEKESSIDLEGSPDAGHYPMDYYSSTGGSWAGTHHRASAAASAASAARRKGAARRAAAAAAAATAAPVS